MPLSTRCLGEEEEFATVSFKRTKSICQSLSLNYNFVPLYEKSEPQQNAVERIYGGTHHESNHPATYEEDENEADHAERVVYPQSAIGQHVAEDVAAIERRQRQQVEDGQQEIDEEGQVQQQGQRKERRKGTFHRRRDVIRGKDGYNHREFSGCAGVFHDHQSHSADQGCQEIACRAGEGRQYVVARDSFEVACSDRSGLCPADEEASKTRHKEHRQRDQQRSDGVNVLDGIEGYAAKHAGRLVAQARSHPRVRRLMQAEGKEQNGKLKQLYNDVLTHCMAQPVVCGSES